MNKAVFTYRSAVLLLALGYWVHLFFVGDRTAFGLQFRFLTIWALTANVIVAAHMVRLTRGRTQDDWNGFVSMVVVLNMAVVLNYWRLYFDDPANVQGPDGIPWYREFYLHAIGPLLMWIDAFFILGAFKRMGRTLLWVLALGLVYPLWVELLVHPLNDSPSGSITSGLPYPFLNNMELGERLTFYSTISAVNFVLAGLCWGVLRLRRR